MNKILNDAFSPINAACNKYSSTGRLLTRDKHSLNDSFLKNTNHYITKHDHTDRWEGGRKREALKLAAAFDQQGARGQTHL